MTQQSQWAKTIQPKSDQLNADDLIAGNRIITIRDVRVVDSQDQPAFLFYEGDNGKPYKPCKTMRKLIAHCWGVNEFAYIGRSMELYRDESVKWAGEEVGGIRIKAMSHIPARKRIALQLSRNKRIPFTVEPLVLQNNTPAQPPAPSQPKSWERPPAIGSDGLPLWGDWVKWMIAKTSNAPSKEAIDKLFADNAAWREALGNDAPELADALQEAALDKLADLHQAQPASEPEAESGTLI